MTPSETETPPLETLLAEFLDQGRSEKAFSELMQAAGGMVYGSIYRRTLDAQLAEEITQNVFIVLARKAEKIRSHPSLSAWLFRTARLETETALRTQRRRQHYHQQLSQNPTSSSHQPDMIANEQLGLLEQSIDALKPKERELVILRHLEGKSFKDIARQTGLSEGACKMRLQRTLTKMSSWLKQRGCTLSVTALAGLLATEKARACPPSLVQSTLETLSKAPSSSATNTTTTATNSALGIKPLAMLLATVGLTAVGVLAYHLTQNSPSQEHAETGNHSPALPEQPAPSSLLEKPSSNQQPRPQEKTPTTLTNYPYAYERLEELYQDFPSLRPATPRPVESESHFSIEFVERLKNSRHGHETLPPQFQKMLSGEAEWDQQAIAEYLTLHQDRLDTLRELAWIEPTPMHEDFRVKNSSPDHPFGPIQTLLESSALLRLSFLHAQSLGHYEQASSDLTAYLRLGRNIGQNGIIYELFEEQILHTAWQDLTLLKHQSHDISQIAPLVKEHQPTQGLIQALRYETGAIVSLFGFLNSAENPLQMASHIFGGSVSPEQGPVVLQAMMNTTIPSLEYDFARINHALIERLLQAELQLPLREELTMIADEQYQQMQPHNAVLLQTFMSTELEPLSQITQAIEERKQGIPDELSADLHPTSGEFPVKIDPELEHLFSFDPITGQFTLPAPSDESDL